MKIPKFLNLPTVDKGVASLIIKRVMQSDIEDLAMLRRTDKTTKTIIDDLLGSKVGANMIINEFARLAGEPSAQPINIDPQQNQFDPKPFYKLKDFCLWAGFTKNWRNLENDSCVIAYALTTQHPTELVTNQELFAKVVNALRNPNIPLITKDMVARQLKILCATSTPANKEHDSANLIKESILAEEKHPEYLKARSEHILNRYRDHLKKNNIKFSETDLDEMTIKLLKRTLETTNPKNIRKIQNLKDLINHAQNAKSSTQKLSLAGISYALRFQNQFNEVIAELNEDNRFIELESQLTRYSLANDAYQDSADALPIANDLSRDHYCMTHLPLNYFISRVINARYNMYVALDTKYQSQWPWCNLENIDFDAYYHLLNPARISNLQYADLRGANFVKSNLNRYYKLHLDVNMKGSRLTRANLQQTRLTSNIEGAILDKALFYGSSILTEHEADLSKAEGVSVRYNTMNNKKLSSGQRFRLIMMKHGFKIAAIVMIPTVCVGIILLLGGLVWSIPVFVSLVGLLLAFLNTHLIVGSIITSVLATTALFLVIGGVVAGITDSIANSARYKKNITSTTLPAHNQEQRPDTDSQLRDLFNPKRQQIATDNPFDLAQFSEFNVEKVADPAVQSGTHLKTEEKRPINLGAALFGASQDDEPEKADEIKVKASTEQQPVLKADAEDSRDATSSPSLF